MATVLSPGDIAIVHYTADDPDAFSFVFLRDVEAGTAVNFTDNGWLAAGGFRPGEGTATYVAPTDIAAGTVIQAPLGDMELDFLGDQIIVYQGAASSPTLLYAVDFADNDSTFAADATSAITSALPTGLTLGVTAVALPFDNAVYSGPPSGSQLDMLEAIGNPGDWSGSDTVRQPRGVTPITFNDKPAIDLDFNNSTGFFRSFRTEYSQGGTSVRIADADTTVFDNDDFFLFSATITIVDARPDQVLSVGVLPFGIDTDGYRPLTGTLTLSGFASQADYTTAIERVEFSSTNGQIGDVVRIGVSVDDGNEASFESTAFIEINGLAGTPTVPPVLDLDANNSNGGGADYTATFTEGGPDIPVADADVTITDSDSLTIRSATISFTSWSLRPAEDVLAYTGPAGGPITASVYDPNTGILTLTGEATLDAYEAALRQVVYRNTSSTPFTADRAIQVTVNDGSTSSNVATTYMHVVDVAGVAPTLDLDANNSTTPGANYVTGFIQGGAAVAVGDDDVTISDDGANIVSATITLTNLRAGDVLAPGGGFPGGITAVFNPVTGVMTLDGTASRATYQDALEHVLFSTTNASTATRTIAFVVNDGVRTSNTATTYVQVTAPPIPVAPTLDLDPDNSGGSVRATFHTTFTEDGVPIPIADADTTITDDGNTIVSATITLTNRQASDLLAAPLPLPAGIVASTYDPGSGILTLTGGATLDDYEVALQRIRFSTAGDDPVAGERRIEVVVNDGANDSNVADALVVVAAVNDAPVLTVDATATYVENDPALTISPLARLADADDTEIVSAVVAITEGSFPGDGDVLTLSGSTSGTVEGITFEWHPAERTLTLSGADSLATYQEVLRNIEFQSTSDNPTDFGASPTRTLSWSVSDGTSGVTVTSTLDIAPRNDPPELVVADARTYSEGAAPVVVSPVGAVADVDNFNLTSGLVAITAGGVAGDVLTVNGALSGTFAGIDFSFVAGVGLSFSGSAPVANYQAFVEAVEFESTGDNPTNFGLNPTRTLAWTLSDGRDESATGTSTITIVAQNDAPVAQDGAAGGDEDTVIAGMAIADDADHVASLLTYALVGADGGAANGTVVMNGGGSFTYTPDANFSGSDSFQFQATDPDDATSNVATISVAVAALNDAPVAQDGTASGDEDTVIAGMAVAADVDHAANDLTYSLVGAGGGAVNGTVAMNADGSFTYTPAADFFGSDSFRFQVTDPDSAASNVATIVLAVVSQNDAPLAQDGAANGDEGSVIAGAAVATDVDHAADRLSYSLVGENGGAANGSVVMKTDGSFTYIPNLDFVGDDSFRFQAIDPDGAISNPATIAVTVEDVIEPDIVSLPDVLWRHDAGTVRTASGVLGSLATTSAIGAIGDFDADGDSDVIWHDASAQVAIWAVEDGGTVAETHDLPGESVRWRIEGSGDFDGDGDDEVLWRHRDGLTVTWEMEDGEYLVNHNHFVEALGSWQVDGTGDFDGDGDDEILWRHFEGLVVTWEMEDGEYVVNHNHAVVDRIWQVQGTGDFDNDGDDDILWRRDDGLVVIWTMADGEHHENHILGPMPTEWQIEGTFDLTDDGTSDILWRHDDGRLLSWEIQNATIASTQDQGVVDNSWRIRDTGEFPLI